jgi:hypothetical protein
MGKLEVRTSSLKTSHEAADSALPMSKCNRPPWTATRPSYIFMVSHIPTTNVVRMCLNARMNSMNAKSQLSYSQTEAIQEKAHTTDRACLVSDSRQRFRRRRLAIVTVRDYIPMHFRIKNGHETRNCGHVHSQRSNSPSRTSHETGRTCVHMTMQLDFCFTR